MPIGEIVGFINSNVQETLDKLINRRFDEFESEIGSIVGKANIKIIQFDANDPLPLSYGIGTEAFVLLQQKDGLTYRTRHDDLLTDLEGNITINTVKPFDGRLIYMEGNMVKVIPFTEEDEAPLRVSYKDTGQFCWVMMALLEELVGEAYVRRPEPIAVHADGSISVDLVRRFNGRLILVGG